MNEPEQEKGRAVGPGRIQTPNCQERSCLSLYTGNSNEAMVVVYDLSDPQQWTAAGEHRRAWGHKRTEIHVLTNDVIAIEFKPGGALEASA